MKLRIYDYENRPVDIELPDKPIHSIIVLMPRIRRADEGLIIATVIIRSMEI